MKLKVYRKGCTKVLLTLCAILICSATGLSAQVLSGRVTDTSGETIIGASVLVKGTTNGTVTDIDGKYTLNNVPQNATVVYSYIGYVTQEIVVKGRSVINVELKNDNVLLEDVVVIGYGSVKKSDLTGAVSVVKPDKFKEKANTSVGDMLQGAASGVTVRSTGEIGGTPSIQIRGTGNLTNNDPLYVIDGLPTSNDNNFNVNDVESIQILKDASAAAIYGSRAANGVIIITTKSGNKDKSHIEFSSQLAIQKLPRLDLAKADEWKALYDVAYDNAIASGVEGITERLKHWDNDTDWQDAYFKTGVTQTYDLGYSGGTQNGTFRASFNYMNNDGTTLNRRMERYTLRINSKSTWGRLTIGENISIGRTDVKNNSSGAIRKVGGAIADVIRMLPTIPVYDNSEFGTTGGFGKGNLIHARALGANPVANANNGGNKRENIFVRGSAYAEVSLFSWLKYKLNLGVDISNVATDSWSTGYATALNTADGNSSATASNSRNSTFLVENTFSFDKTFKKHHINAVIGNSYQRTDYRTSSATMQNLVQTSDGKFLTTVSAGTSDASASGTKYAAALISYLGRINYDYDGKYLLSLTGRIDGSSRFARDYRWGTFPSVSAAWRISKENFFNVNWIDDLKIRVNWGNLGSQNVGYYDYQMFVSKYPQYLFNGAGQGISYGQIIMQLANQDLTWERMEQKNFGIDMAFLKNRLQVTAEYYIATSHDVLTALPILMSTGNAGGSPYVNAASIENKGFELTATWNDQVNDDFSYSISANISHSDNLLKKFGYGKNEQYTDYTTTRVGEPIGMFYLIQTDGIFQSKEEVNNYKTADGKVIQPNAEPGDLRYIDVNGDGQITPDGDRVVCGSPWPDFEYGLNLSATYKNFDFGVIAYGKVGGKAYNFNRWYLEGLQDCNASIAGYQYWSLTNTKSKNPRPLYGDERNSYVYIDRWLEDASFLRISSMSVGYNWKPGFLKKYVENIRFSVAAQNLLTFTGYSGYDADFQGTLFEPGMDFCTYPSPKSFIFSLNVKL